MEKNSKKTLGWIVAGLLAAYITYFFAFTQGTRSQKPLPSVPITNQQTPLSSIRVHVSGAVKNPGVYTLPNQSRIQDAIHKAGGPLKNANINALNLADWASDGSKIEVPYKALPVQKIVQSPAQPSKLAPRNSRLRFAHNSSATTHRTTVSNAAPPAGEPTDSSGQQVYITSPVPNYSSAGIPPEGYSSNTSHRRRRPVAPKPLPKTSDQYLTQLSQNPVNLNTATLAELQKLPGVGPKMAERILTYRSSTGGFRSVGELNNVPGIGEKRMAQLQSLVYVQ